MGKTIKERKAEKEKIPMFSKASLEGEIWKPVNVGFEHSNPLRIEISNLGRVRTFSKWTDGDISKGSIIKGYRYVYFRFYKKRSSVNEKRFAFMQGQMITLGKQKTKLKAKLRNKKSKDEEYLKCARKLNELTKLLKTIKENYTKELRADEKNRMIPFRAMVHRLVAEYFVEQPSKRHTVASHLDYDKRNNHYSNIKWMTKKENYAHQQGSPNVIAARKRPPKKRERNENSKVYKLTSTRVMLIKKKINEGVKLSTLAKTFKVTEMQLSRIKRGINWGHVKAAN